jgi:hypothetical protein
MTKLQKKCIAIVVGIIVTYLFTYFFEIPYPIGDYISGWIFSEAIIATLAWIFGTMTGGMVSLISQVLLSITRGFFSTSSLLYILLYGSYGFIIGVLFKNKTIKTDGKNIFADMGLFSLSAACLYFLICIINIFCSSFRGGYSASNYLRTFIFSSIINSIFIGVISFLLLLFYCKYLKLNIPFFPNEKRSSEILQNSVPVKKSSFLLSLIMTIFIQNLALICSQILFPILYTSLVLFVILVVIYYVAWGILLCLILKKILPIINRLHIFLMIINPVIIFLLLILSFRLDINILATLAGIVWGFLLELFVTADDRLGAFFYLLINLPLSLIIMPISFYLIYKILLNREDKIYKTKNVA